MNLSNNRRMRRKLPNQCVVTKINLLVFDDVEHEFSHSDESEAAKPNQRVEAKINLLVLDDVEHELVVEEADEMEATKPNQTNVLCSN